MNADLPRQGAKLHADQQGNGHLQRTDRQITLHAITCSPTDHTLGMQVWDHSQIEPVFAGPDIADVTGPFLVRPVCLEVAIQLVRRDVERVIAVRCHLVFARSDDRYAVLTHQPADSVVTDIQADLF